MKRNVSVVCVCSRCNILISGKIIKEIPGSVAIGTHCIRIPMKPFCRLLGDGVMSGAAGSVAACLSCWIPAGTGLTAGEVWCRRRRYVSYWFIAIRMAQVHLLQDLEHIDSCVPI